MFDIQEKQQNNVANKKETQNDSIDASLRFDFKGESFYLTSHLPLPQYASASMTDIYTLLAQEHDVDIYSHAFDAMMSYPITFRNAKGSAQHYLSSDGDFNFTAYRLNCEHQRILQTITPIARDLMQIDNLDVHPKLKQTLIAVYKAAQPRTTDDR